MKKCERGILGYKKDPKNQILFSFGVRQGDEWPSDDSEDSDYEPTKKEAEEFNIKLKSKKRKSDEKLETKSKKRRIVNTADKGGGSNKQLLCCALPTELWLKIFQLYVAQHGALPFLCRASKVCRLWNEVASDPCLWRKVDLSYGWIKSTDRTLLWLCDNRLSQCEDINLSSWKDLSGNAVKVLSEKCPNLRSVNLSWCKKISPEAVMCLADNCKHLCDLDVSFTNIPVSCTKYLVQKCKSKMSQLSVAGNKMIGFNTVLNTLMMCPELELLDISNAIFSTDFVTFGIEKIQETCPKLKVLRLTNSKFRAPDVSQNIQAASPGFVHLRELSLGVSSDRDGFQSRLWFNDRFLQRILKTSYDLKLLDLRGNAEVSDYSLISIPATDIEHLYLSRTDGSKFHSLSTILKKWAHSLLELDLSWTVYSDRTLNDALLDLVDWPAPQSKLRSINLAGTSVDAKSVKRLYECCGNLEYINLTSCRGLPRGMKREYKKKDFKLLKKDIRNQMDDSSSD